MHELSIANEILKILQSHAPSGEAIAIGVRLGAWSCVHEDALVKSFQWVVQDTPYSQVRLETKRDTAIWLCSTCQQGREIPETELQSIEPSNCPWCGDAMVVDGSVQDMEVEWIELMEESEVDDGA